MDSSQITYVYIGGGAAGYFGAINGARKHPHAKHILLEATHRPMTKIKISGGGRCNVTHHCFEAKELVKNYPRGSKELLSAFARFQAQDTVAWFKDCGVELKVESDGRMFPVSNSSETILECFRRETEKSGVELRKGCKVNAISKKDSRFHLLLSTGEELLADKVLLATGSFPTSYELAKSLGHTIVAPVPSLFTFNCKDTLLHEMMGTSFKTVSLKLYIPEIKKPWEQKGPLLITHWGLSGPAVLKLSAFAARELHACHYHAKLFVNWVNSSDSEIFEALTEFKNQNTKKSVQTTALFELSKRFWQHLIVEILNSKQHAIWGDLNKKDLQILSKALTASELNIEGKGVFKEEFVSAGGIDLKEVDFKTMQSKICPGLFFAGEVLDIDGITGGFNFQNAWTTSWIASQSM